MFRPILLYAGFMLLAALAADWHGYGLEGPDGKTVASCCQLPGAAAAGLHDPAHAGPEACPCDHARGECHCPGCGAPTLTGGMAGQLTVPTVLSIHPFRTENSAAFYFNGQLPEPVWPDIWEPPKWSA